MRKVTSFLFAAALLAACNSSTIDKKVDVQTAKEDWTSIKKEHPEYESSDFEHAVELAASEAMHGILTGKTKQLEVNTTYRALLDSAKAERQRTAVAQKAYDDALKSIRDMVAVRVTGKEFLKGEYDYRGRVHLNYNIKNNSGKSISGINGALEIQDMFGKTLMGCEVKETDGMKAAEQTEKEATYTAGIGTDETALQSNELSKLKFIWTPYEIIFEDGSSIKAPEKPE